MFWNRIWSKAIRSYRVNLSQSLSHGGEVSIKDLLRVFRRTPSRDHHILPEINVRQTDRDPIGERITWVEDS